MKLLVLEDEGSTRELIRHVCSNRELEVTEAESGHEALEILNVSPVDIIILDLFLPKMSGIDFLRYLRQEPSMVKTPVIICSAIGDVSILSELISLGIQGYVRKPINPKDLLNQIDEIWKKVVPIIEEPGWSANRKGVELAEYWKRLDSYINETKQRLNDLERLLENGEIEYFEQFALELSISAANLGARRLQIAAMETSIVVPKLRRAALLEHQLNLVEEVTRLEQAIFEHSDYPKAVSPIATDRASRPLNTSEVVQISVK